MSKYVIRGYSLHGHVFLMKACRKSKVCSCYMDGAGPGM